MKKEPSQNKIRNVHYSHYQQKNHQNYLNHHKRGMVNKKLFWSILLILVLIVVVIVYVFLIQQRGPKPDPLNVQCAYLCETGQKNAFCNIEKKLNENLRASCDELSKNPAYSKYKVLPCNKFSCELTPEEKDQTCVTGLGGTWEFPDPETGRCKQFGDYVRRKMVPSDNPPIEGQICCR
jgi:hypothetical protein